MYLRYNLAPETRVTASEIFNRSWRFIERDPVLAGEEHQRMQDKLAELILVLMSSGERDRVVIANRAIATLRQHYAAKRRHHPDLTDAAA